MKIKLLYYNGQELDADLSAKDVYRLKNMIVNRKKSKFSDDFLFQSDTFGTASFQVYDDLFLDSRVVSTILEKLPNGED